MNNFSTQSDPDKIEFLNEKVKFLSSPSRDYCISSYKARGYYFFTRPSTAGIIRMRALLEGVDYSMKLSILKLKLANFIDFYQNDTYSLFFMMSCAIFVIFIDY